MRVLHYYSLAPAAAICFLWLFAGTLALLAKLPRKKLVRVGIAAAAGLSAAGLIFISCPPAFRVLYDETAFLNSAQALLATGKPGRGQEWIWSGGTLVPLEDIPPFRPALFPLLTAAAGLWAGPAPWHGFLVSFLAAAVLLTLVFLAAETPRKAALQCAFVLGGAVFCFTAASSGYDMLSLGLGFLTCLLLHRYERQRSSTALGALLAAGLCFAHTRNEGILGFLILWLYLAVREWKNTNLASKALMPLALPLLVPLVAQRLDFYPHVEVGGLGDLLSPAHMPGHFLELARAFFFEPFGPFPVLVHWLGAWMLVRNRARLGVVAIPTGLFLVALLLLLLAFHEGGIRHPFQARLYLPFSFLFCLWAGSAWDSGTRWRSAAMVVAAVQLALCFPVLRQGYAYYRHRLVDEAAAIKELVEKSPPRSMFVYFSSGMAAAFGRASVRPKTFERDRPSFDAMARRESVGPVFLVESWPPHQGTITTSLEEGEARLVEEIPLPGLRYLRVLELTSPAGPPVQAPK